MSYVTYENRYRILAVDPSTSANGFTVLDYDLLSRKVYVIHAETVLRQTLVKGTPWLKQTYGDREAAVHGYKLAFQRALIAFDPTAVIVESPYKRFLTAFRALTELQAVYRESVIEWDVTAPFFTIDPSSVKKNIGVKGDSGNKDLIPLALAKRDDIIFTPSAPLTGMDEHQADSVAVGLYHIDNYVAGIIPKA